MATLADMRDEILDDLDRADLASQAEKAIRKAIRRFQTERFHFNEKRFTFATVAGQALYGAGAHAYLPDLYTVDTVELIDGASTFELARAPVSEMDGSNVIGSTGQPAFWGYFDRQFRLHSVPNAVYTVQVSAHVKVAEPAALSDDGNAWMSEAWDLIASRAKWHLAVHLLKDGELASAMIGANADALNTLSGRVNKMGATGQVRAFGL